VPRVPYVPEDIAEPREIVDAVRKRRGGTLLSLDRLLLHSPPLAAGWNAYLGAVRTQLSLDAKPRELAICADAIEENAEKWGRLPKIYIETTKDEINLAFAQIAVSLRRGRQLADVNGNSRILTAEPTKHGREQSADDSLIASDPYFANRWIGQKLDIFHRLA
jgi:hypothetical protein